MMEESLDQADNPLAARMPRFALFEQGMRHLGPVHWNLTAPYLYEHAIRRHEEDRIRAAYLRQPDSAADADDWPNAEEWKE